MWTLGIIETDSGMIVAKPGLTPDALRLTELPLPPPKGKTGPGSERIYVGPIVIKGTEFGIAIYFHNGRLHMADMALSA